MVLEISYNQQSADFCAELTDLIKDKFSAIEVISYREDSLKERKKALRLKGAWGTRLCPFALLTDEKPIKAFYSDDRKCTVENIVSELTRLTSNVNDL